MTALRFYLRQAYSNLMAHQQRTLFVLFSIAVGVAAVVSLRSVGLMIGDGLTRNLQADNRADIVVTLPPIGPGFESKIDESLVEKRGEHGPTTFSVEGIQRIRDWADDRGIELILAARSGEPTSVFGAGTSNGDSSTALAFYIEPRKYPFYGELAFLEPAESTLASALEDPQSVVVTARLATELQIGLGDRIEVRGPEPFVVTAILDSGSEARLREMEAVLLPYLFLRYDRGEQLGVLADTVYLKLDPSTDLGVVREELAAAFVGLELMTTEDLRQQNQQLSDTLTKLMTTLGLIALLIGGIGIVNTMLVVVGRRTLEIGVLKTIGIQGHRITVMFLVEALLVGILGSVFGVALGLALVTLLQGIAERVVAQTLELTIFPEAILVGLGTGVLVTLVFGFLPTLAAGRVRPSVVLQPDRATLPKAGRASSFLVVAALTAIMALPVGRILENTLLGFAVAYGTVLALGAATLLFWLLIRLVDRLPAPRNTTLKLAQRAVGTHPGRTATTLLALVVGMFSLSSILLMTGSLLNVIEDVLEERLGGDLIAVPRTADVAARTAARLAEIDGVEDVQHDVVYRVSIAAINGDRNLEALLAAAYEAAREETDEGADDEESEGATSAGEGADEPEFDSTRYALQTFTKELDVARRSDINESYEIETGADLGAEAESRIVLRESDATEWLGLAVGDTLTLTFGGGEERTASISGTIAAPQQGNFEVNVGDLAPILATDAFVPPGTVPHPTPFIVDLRDEDGGDVLRALARIEGLFVLKVSVVNKLLTGLFQKLTALPLVIAILALFASGVIIANTVSLAVLERRRQIGVMKAVGMQSRDVLRLLLVENGMVGLLGGIIGCGIGAACILFLGVLSESPGSFPYSTMALLVALAVAIALAATLLTAWGASREKPLVVLRYE